MADLNAIQLIQDALKQPLSSGEARRVVFWHDVAGSFEEDFDRLTQEGIGCELARALVFAKADDGSQFELKKKILRDQSSDDFLIYTRRPRDFSEGGLEGNWLADIELVSEHFQADKASMLLGDINAGNAARDAVAQFEKFFGAADRRAAYLSRMPETNTAADVAVGIVSVILKAATARVEDIAQAYLCALHDSGAEFVIADLELFDALGALSSILKKRLGYEGDIVSETELSEHLLISAASCTLPEELLSGYEAHIAKPYSRFCLNIVRDWMSNQSNRETLYEIARNVEAELNIPERLAGAEVSALIDTDVFPCTNEVILAKLMSSLADGSDRRSEALSTRQKRKDLKWYRRVEGLFDLLSAAADTEGFYRDHSQGFHATKPADVWKAYTTDWCAMDAAYRAFCTALDVCLLNTDDIPDALRDAAERLAERVENVYVNWFLPRVNTCWINCAESDWGECGFAKGIEVQRDFFQNYPYRDAKEYKRTLVIIADGMRYEVGRELARRLEQETKGTLSLDAFQSSFPSVTEFGMAALLPHKEISYSWDDGQVSIDGRPTKSTPDREAVLQGAVPGARAVLSENLRAGNRAARKELVGDAPLVYVYQDKIDSTGEKPKLEHGVFKACGDTVDELVALCKIA
ncbi:MAG: BREX-1 system phosphatase PglZ type A, partial [Gordonibacter sp.]